MDDFSFLVAEASANRPRFPPPNIRKVEAFDLDQVYKPAGWTKDKEKYKRRVARWKEKKVGNELAVNFGLSRSMFSPEASLLWECTDILGRGIFGTVGLWQQLDERGRSVDVSHQYLIISY
jgi:hypothetical protein